MRAMGIDISKYQKTFNPNAATKEINFVIQRTSYGMVTDEEFEVIYSGVMKVPLRMAYHYFSTAAPWKEQADRFLFLTGGRGYRTFFIDYEHSYNNLNQESAVDAGAMRDYVFQKSGIKTELYAGAYTYRDRLINYVEWPKKSDLWIAHYSGTDPQTTQPNLLGTRKGTPSPSGKEWVFWQWTDQAPPGPYGCGGAAVDLNVFNGTVKELEEYLKVEEEIVSPTPLELKNKQIEVLDDVIASIEAIKKKL